MPKQISMFACETCGRTWDTPRLATICEMSHATQESEPIERVMSQGEFCERVGITEPECKVMRDLGYVPSYGQNPLKIPLLLGVQGVQEYIIDATRGEIGKNARFPKKSVERGMRGGHGR